jgi:hypothetical protein
MSKRLTFTLLVKFLFIDISSQRENDEPYIALKLICANALMVLIIMILMNIYICIYDGNLIILIDLRSLGLGSGQFTCWIGMNFNILMIKIICSCNFYLFDNVVIQISQIRSIIILPLELTVGIFYADISIFI